MIIRINQKTVVVISQIKYILIIIFSASLCSCNYNSGKINTSGLVDSTLKVKNKFNRLFPKMKPIHYMRNLNSNKVKPFNFYFDNDSILIENITFYKSHIYDNNDIFLGMSNDSLYSLINYGDGVYSKYLFIVFNKNYENILIEPFGAHKIYLKEIIESKYIYELYEIKETYDLAFNSLDSIEIREMSISKKYGIEKIEIKDKTTNEIFIAKSYMFNPRSR